MQYRIMKLAFLCVMCTGAACTSTDYGVLEIPAGQKLSIDCNADLKATVHHVRDMPVYVVCRDDADILALEKVSESVYRRGNDQNPDAGYRAVRKHIFVAIAVSPGTRCLVEYVPHGRNKHGWDASTWYGGFYSPCESEVFDMAGRLIMPGKYSPTNYPKDTGDLVVPPYKFLSDAEIEFL